jgi:beta-glucosidase
VAAFLGNWTGEHAPGLRDVKVAFQVAHHLLFSHGEAVQALRAEARRPIHVGVALNLQPVHPASAHSEDVQAARRWDGLLNRWFLDPLFLASYPPDVLEFLGPSAPRSEAEDFRSIATPLDFLGVNYYTRVLACQDSSQPLLQVSQVQPPGVERSAMWEVYPSGLGEVLHRLWTDYHPRSLIITENGTPGLDVCTDAGRVHDAHRISFLERHVAVVRAAVAHGVPVRGYFVWSLMDNFEWAMGYRMRFGLVHVDFNTQVRTLKSSALWYRQLVRGRPL